ncbi:MAG: adenylate/guanylate cyclase domain-containing protein [Limisphaerales bacterium]
MCGEAGQPDDLTRIVGFQLAESQVTLGGEKRKISVLFCDIRGFTALTEGMDPGEVIAMLNEHMTALADVVAANKGVVDKFVGDEIMAVFGAPKSYGDDTFNAVKAGLDMITERRKLNESSNYQISIGIGISTGEAVAGNMGSQNRLNYTVLGERVNLGARFCGVAEPGEVVIGDSTLTELGERITVEDKDLVRLKGFTDEIKAFRVVDAKG